MQAITVQHYGPETATWIITLPNYQNLSGELALWVCSATCRVNFPLQQHWIYYYSHKLTRCNITNRLRTVIMASSRPKRDTKPPKDDDFLYSFPPSTARNRNKAQKNTTRVMKSKSEKNHWDLVSNTRQSNGTTSDGTNHEIYDAQFWTPRLPAWKDLQAADEYPTAKWELIDHGEQMKISDYMILNLYNSSKVMAQGPHFKDWTKTEFTGWYITSTN